MSRVKKVVALGGTLRVGSSTEAAMRRVLVHAERLGAETRIFAGAALDLPLYAPHNVSNAPAVTELIAALRSADAIIFGSPGYHGGISGAVKNAIDYTEEMARDASPYFSGKPVGCIATGAGWQGCNATLAALRGVVHALRGWPTPMGIAINSINAPFDADGACAPELDNSFAIMARELLDFQLNASRI